MLVPVCPACLGPLDDGGDTRRCRSCPASYRSLRGIPDLRTAEDGYLPNAEDWEFALRLDAAYDRLDFRGLLDFYYDLCPEVTPDLQARQVGHILTSGPRSWAWAEALGPGLPGGPWLDLGCGSGSFLAATAGDREGLVGLDVAMRWLLVARKRLDEAGLGSVGLVCGNAERIPFGDQTFAAVVAGDVIEHVADQAATLAEAYRALMPGGRLFLASPNRFSLAPEPHVGVWGVGYLPRRWMEAYVKFVRRVDFRAIRTLSYAEWTRTIARSPFGRGSIRAPILAPSDMDHAGPITRAMGLAYNRLASTRVGQAMMRRVGPLFHVVATRPVPPGPTPPPPPPTTP